MTVLLPMLNVGGAPLMLEMAATLATGNILAAPSSTFHYSLAQSPSPAVNAGPRIVVLSVVQVPPYLPLSRGVEMARSYRALLDYLPSEIELGEHKVRVDRVVRVAREVASAVCMASQEEGADLVLFHWRGYPKEPDRHTYGSIIDATLRDLRCDVALFRPDGWLQAERVLLAVRGGPSAELALDLAVPIATKLTTPLTVLHNVPPVRETEKRDPADAQGQAALRDDEPYIHFSKHLRDTEGTTGVPLSTVLTLEEDPAAALLGEAHEGDLLVMGMAPLERGGSSTPNLASTLAHERGLPMLVVRASSTSGIEEYAEQARIRSGYGHRDMPFEQWFVENTYHADEFRDPEEFLRLKQASGLTISVGLLTSHDEKQIYSVVTGLKRVLQEMHPIADEIVVVDAGLGTETAEIARSLGVQVYTAEEVLPQAGSLHGRGESWWKSLAVMRGDVLVWLDPRAVRFHPSTAMALAGPLLRLPTLQLVKAFARSQHQPRGKRKEKGDELDAIDWGATTLTRREQGMLAGRIRVQAMSPADLLALPTPQLAEMPPHTLVQVLYPPLAGVVSPFGRDMAARREAMRQAPALTGENNELALLLWTAATYGTRAIAQVELRHARPAPPPMPNLKSALDVLQILARKLPDPGARHDAVELAEHLQKELDVAPPPTAAFEVRALGPVERPPIGNSKF
jgi:glucosyl-3-phosphoglycerate synthase